MKAGISSIAMYVPPLYLSHDDLADARGIDRDKFRIGLGSNNMAIVPPWDDPVTMAANAAEMAIEAAGIEKDEIGLLIVSTETGVDQSKPVASFVHGLLGIGHRARVYEIKHACYGGTVAIMNAIDWVKSQHHNGKKALVVTSDIAKYGLNTSGEPTQGAGAVALIISDQTEFVHFLPDLNACFAKDVHDFWRPNGSAVPKVDGKYSIECYKEALDSCTRDLQDNLIRESGGNIYDFVDYFIYHLPFTKMAKKAHIQLLASLNPDMQEEELEAIYNETYSEKIEPALVGAQEVGNIYTGSVYMCLTGLLEGKGRELINKNIGVFSYGSGCGAEFLVAHVGKELIEQEKNFRFNEQLKRRKKITVDQYELLYGDEAPAPSKEFAGYSVKEDPFSRYIYIGEKDFKRQYIRTDSI